MTDTNKERFAIMGECESLGIEDEFIDQSPTVEGAFKLVCKYTESFHGWYIWYVDTEQELRHA